MSNFVSDNCPIPDSHDKFNEAHYYIGQMLENYHDPDRFRWNLNSFIQSLRNITFALQKELDKKQGFQEWYENERSSMKQDELLNKFGEGRNIVVKQGNLKIKSTSFMGKFENRKLKLGFGMDVPLFAHSAQIIEKYKDGFMGFIMDKEHAAIGEQLGVQRKWIADELGSTEVVDLCDVAWSRIGKVISNAHKFCGSSLEPPNEHDHDISSASVLLESDIDPTLPKKWGWLE